MNKKVLTKIEELMELGQDEIKENLEFLAEDTFIGHIALQATVDTYAEIVQAEIEETGTDEADYHILDDSLHKEMKESIERWVNAGYSVQAVSACMANMAMRFNNANVMQNAALLDLMENNELTYEETVEILKGAKPEIIDSFIIEKLEEYLKQLLMHMYETYYENDNINDEDEEGYCYGCDCCSICGNDCDVDEATDELDNELIEIFKIYKSQDKKHAAALLNKLSDILKEEPKETVKPKEIEETDPMRDFIESLVRAGILEKVSKEEPKETEKDPLDNAVKMWRDGTLGDVGFQKVLKDLSDSYPMLYLKLIKVLSHDEMEKLI